MKMNYAVPALLIIAAIASGCIQVYTGCHAPHVIDTYDVSPLGFYGPQDLGKTIQVPVPCKSP